MRTFIVVLMTRILCEALAYLETDNYPLNVGTVLFTAADTTKTQWNKREIALLKTRRHFQSLIPSRRTIDTQNDKYVEALLKYFKKAYRMVKREASNYDVDSIMTMALSDVVGGYLKVWALPITKFSYYAGGMSEDNAIRMYKFYNEIRNYLGTDGTGWKAADPSIIYHISVKTPSKRTSKSRSTANPCENLAYYEKTPTGLTVPTPIINWELDSNTMFLPLKNTSLVTLESANPTTTLFRYYDIAKSCMKTSSQAEQEHFDHRFQTWLTDDVVPHLSDERLYLALGSVLTLVNNTNGPLDATVNLHTNHGATANVKGKFIPRKLPINFCSKKVMIITIILFLEIAWCIPALLYITCKKKKKDGCSNVYLFVESKNDKKKFADERFKLEQQPAKTKKNRRDIGAAPSFVEANFNDILIGSNTEQRSHKNASTKQSSVCKSSMATDVQSFFSSKVCSTEVARVFYESPPISLKSSLKKLSSEKTETTKSDPIIIQKSISLSTMQKCKETKSVSKRGSGKTPTVKTQTSKHSDKNKNNPLKDRAIEVCDGCPCIACLDEECIKEASKEKQISKSEKIDKPSKTTLSRSEKDIVATCKVLRFPPPKEIKISRANKGLKLSSGKPYVEITIDRPETEISVGIGSVIQRHAAKPSKIPKRTSANVMQALCPTKDVVIRSPMTSKRTIIQQPKTQVALDDIVIKHKDTTSTGKLNTTL